MKTYCEEANKLSLWGRIIEVVDIIVGIILLVKLFDDYDMRWLIAIGCCVFMIISGIVTATLFNCLSIITENQYQELQKKREEA